MLRWIWSISEYNLTARDSRKRTRMGGPFMRERRGSGPEKQQPKHNPCRPVGRNWKEPILLAIDLMRSFSVLHLLSMGLHQRIQNGCSPCGTENLRNTACDWSKPDHMPNNCDHGPILTIGFSTISGPQISIMVNRKVP